MATAEPTPAPATEEKTTTSPVKPTLGKKTIDKPKAKELSPAEAQADRIRKYKVAADVVHQVLETVVPACVEGASVMQLCQDADAEIEKLTASVYNNTKKGPIQKGELDILCNQMSSTKRSIHDRPRYCVPDLHQHQQRRLPLLPLIVSDLSIAADMSIADHTPLNIISDAAPILYLPQRSPMAMWSRSSSGLTLMATHLFKRRP